MSKPKAKYYDLVQNKADKITDILIYGVIGDSWFEESTTARQFVTDFRNAEKDSDRINIRLNSPGGSVFDGLAIFNAISASKKDIHTYNDGVCASMAAVLLLSVKSERIHPAKNSLFMLHSPSTGAWGNREQIESALNVLDKVQKVLVTSVCDKTGLDETEVEKKYFDYKDHWFTADEAKAAKFYSQIEDEEVENVPQNAIGLKFSDLMKLFEPTDSLFPEWINRIAPPSTPPEEILDFIDMDIKKLTAAYKLPEDSTEDAIVAHVAKREQQIADLTAAKTTAETDLATANQTIAAKDAEIVALKKEPGAAPATAPVDTDPKPPTNGDPEPAKDFGTAFADCMNILNPKK